MSRSACRVKCPTCGAVLQVPTDLSSPTLESSSPESSSGSSSVAKRSIPPASGRPSSGSDSFLENLPPPSASSGPPSLPSSAMQSARDEENDRGRRAAPGPLPPMPSTRRPGASKSKPPVNKSVVSEESMSKYWKMPRAGLASAVVCAGCR